MVGGVKILPLGLTRTEGSHKSAHCSRFLPSQKKLLALNSIRNGIEIIFSSSRFNDFDTSLFLLRCSAQLVSRQALHPSERVG